MERTRRTVAVLALLGILWGGPVAAQSPGPVQTPGGTPTATVHRHQGNGRHLAHMLEQLDLSAEQKSKIRTIMQNTEGQPPRDRMRQIRAVLTPEQIEQLKQLRAARRAERGDDQAPSHPTPLATGGP